MTKEEAIKYLKQLYPNGGYTWLDEQRMEAITMAVEALSKPSLPSGVDEAAEEYVDKWYSIHGLDRESYPIDVEVSKADFYAGVKWASEQGETAEVGYWNQRGLSIKLDKPLEKLGFEEGDKVTILINKKKGSEL